MNPNAPILGKFAANTHQFGHEWIVIADGRYPRRLRCPNNIIEFAIQVSIQKFHALYFATRRFGDSRHGDDVINLQSGLFTDCRADRLRNARKCVQILPIQNEYEQFLGPACVGPGARDDDLAKVETLDVGCDLLIVEKALIEMCLGEKGEKAEAEVLIELTEKVGLEKLVYEAESNAHQVWLFKKFGADVNLGPNLDIPIICKLEATRRTLSREGGDTTLIRQAEAGVGVGLGAYAASAP